MWSNSGIESSRVLKAVIKIDKKNGVASTVFFKYERSHQERLSIN